MARIAVQTAAAAYVASVQQDTNVPAAIVPAFPVVPGNLVGRMAAVARAANATRETNVLIQTASALRNAMGSRAARMAAVVRAVLVSKVGSAPAVVAPRHRP